MANKISRKNLQPEMVTHKPYLVKASMAMQGGKPPVIEREQIKVKDSEGVYKETTRQKYLPNNAPATPKKVKKYKIK